MNDLVNCADESTGATAKSICTKLLMQTAKRDISAVEASFELSRIPLYRYSIKILFCLFDICI
jgi:hypothetical protein